MRSYRPLRFSIQGWPLALGVFLPTVYPGNDIMWLPVIAIWFAQYPRLIIYHIDALLVAFIVGVSILTLYGLSPLTDVPWSPAPFGYILLLLCVVMGRSFRPSTIRWLVGLICIEALVCIIQLALGQPYIFAGQRDAVLSSGVTEWGSTELIYFNRTYGLSTNSSVAAQKFMLGVIMLCEIPAKPRWRLLAFVLLAAGLYTTFNRSALLAVGLYLSCKAFGAVYLATPKRLLQVVCLVVLACGMLVVKWPQVKNQFLRGNLDRSLIEESGRSSLWRDAFENISAHPIRGNLSQRFQVSEFDEWYHLHNSWLQLIADHGIIGWLLIAHALAMLHRRNVALFLALALYSFVQFGLFGKISLINIIFYCLMSRPIASGQLAAKRAGVSTTNSRAVSCTPAL